MLALGLQCTSLQCIFGRNKEMLCFQRIVLTAEYINEGHLTHSEGLHFKTELKQNSHCVLARVLTIYSTTTRTASRAGSLKTNSKAEGSTITRGLFVAFQNTVSIVNVNIQKPRLILLFKMQT